MTELLGTSGAMMTGVLACSLALVIGVYLLATPAPFRLAPERRQPERSHASAARTSGLTGVIEGATGVIDRALRRRRDADVHVAVLERAGVQLPLQDFALRMLIATVITSLAGSVLVDPMLGLALALAVPLGARVVLGVLAKRRQAAFGDQLDDALQLMSSSLRAGQSLSQALAAVARDTDQPTSVEFARIINEARVGRELGQALSETAVRMNSKDFVWVTQAIAINREAGGNLAEVLDGVGQTIRERNQLRRQVQSLSAEGKLSAYVLLALPLGVTGFLYVTNPSYLAKFTSSLTGYALLAAAVVLLGVGALWLRRVVSFRF